jgi:histidinol-phosphatase (PHP family)
VRGTWLTPAEGNNVLAKLPADIHLHSKYCGHATGEPEQYVQRAIELGLAAAGFSFHLPIPIPVAYKVNESRAELDLLAREVERLRAAYRNDIPVLFGGEADILPGGEAAVAELAAAYPFDHLIGSVHFLDGWAFDHPAAVPEYAGRDLRQLYEQYFERVIAAMRTGLFDIVGHVDLIKKFGHRPPGDWSDLAERVCGAAAECGLCVEINTAGIDKPAAEPYPSPDVIRRLFAHGVPVTFGSDAHAPGEVGRYFPRAAALARAAGYTSYAAFERRRRSPRPL